MRDLPPADAALNLAVWVALAAAMVVWQARSLVTHRTAGAVDIVRLARRSWTTRCVLLAYWGWVGWHLFVRTTP